MATTAATTGSGPAARWVVRGAGLVLTAAAVAVHVRFWVEAGGLWRDEVNSVVLANGPSVRQLWQTLPYDSFPVLWHAVVRAWSALAGTGDPAARVLGLAVGLSVLAILWWNGRRFGAPAPVVGLVLFGFTSPVLLYGDSVRGYGLGIATALLALGTVWHLSRGVTRWRVVAAGAACLAAVHVLFYNAALVPAFCCGGAAAALTRGGRPGAGGGRGRAGRGRRRRGQPGRVPAGPAAGVGRDPAGPRAVVVGPDRRRPAGRVAVRPAGRPSGLGLAGGVGGPRSPWD